MFIPNKTGKARAM